MNRRDPKNTPFERAPSKARHAAGLLLTAVLLSPVNSVALDQNAPPDVPADSALLELEAPTLPTRRTRPEGEVPAAVHDELLARWNLGGNSDPKHPANRSGFHPGARVVVDATIAGAWERKADLAKLRQRLEARARSRGYWPFRICYEAALRRDPQLTVDHRLRVTVAREGTVLAARFLDELDDGELDSCLQSRLLKLELGALPAQRVDADLRVRFWPGDAPLPALHEPTDAALEPPELMATLARADRAWHTLSGTLEACAAEGRRRDPKLWGRLAFLVEFGPSGSAQKMAQHESRFPDDEVVRCVQNLVASLQLPEPPGEPLVFALRMGSAP